jgi:hypothetical protein
VRHVRGLEDEVGGRGRVEAELLLLARDPDVVGVEDERRNALRARRLDVGAREQQEGRGMLAVRDPLLRPADRPAVPCRLGLRA